MAVTDTKIENWSETTADNAPEGGVKMVRDFAKQFRNMKSVVKLESEQKHIERPDGIQLGTFTRTSDTEYVFTGDVRDIVQPGQMIFGYPPGDSLTRLGFVLSTSFSTDTTVVIDWMQSYGGANIERFIVGLRRDPPSMQANVLSGELTAPDTSNPQSVSFVDHAGTAITLPNNHYVLDITGRAWSSAPEEMVVKTVTKSTTGFTFELGAAPVASVTKWAWIVRLAGWW